MPPGGENATFSPVRRGGSGWLFAGAFGAAGTLGVVAAVALGAGASSCRVYDTSLLEPAGAGGPDGGSGIGWWSKQRGECYTAGIPTPADRPAPQGDDSVGPIFLAIRTMRVGSLNTEGRLDANAWKDIGFDLDGKCTSSPTCPSPTPDVGCKPESAAVAFDGDYCRDNTFGRLEYQAALVPELALKYGFNDDAFNCALCVGAYNFLIRIDGYNGKANDDKVRVDMYPSPGLKDMLPWDCRSPDWKNHPCFTPDLPWLIQDDVVADKTRSGNAVGPSTIFDAAAYVRDGYVVLRLPEDTIFWFPGRRALATAYPLRMKGGIVTAKIGRAQDGTWVISDGIIAGRTTKDDFVHSLRLIGLCEQDKNYGLVQQYVNGSLDSLASGAVDPTKPCDSMSLGLGFTAGQALPGDLVKVEPLVECAGADAGADSGPPDAASEGGVDAGSD